MREASTRRVIDLQPLKRWAHERLPSGPLRDILLTEEDRITAEEFLALVPVWLRLLRVEGGVR